jgi:hypothetical protein
MRKLLLDGMRASLDGEAHFGDVYSVDATLEPGCYRGLEEEVSGVGGVAGGVGCA